MTTTWATRLVAEHGQDLRLYFTIQGVPHVFQEDSEDVPTSLEHNLRPRCQVIENISFPTSKLNLTTRRMEGGSLVITLQDDDDDTLATLFSPRRRRSAYLTADLATGDTTVNVTSTSQFSSSLVAYIDAETVIFTGTTGTTFTTCTRGAYDSIAQSHFGDTERGSGVYTQPPQWKGRRVYLTSYFVDPDGSTTSDLARTEGIYTIEAPPRSMGGGKWELRCAELSDEMYSKKIGLGLKEVEVGPEARLAQVPTTNRLLIELGEENTPSFHVGDYTTQVIVRTTDDEALCRDLVEVDTTLFTMTLDTEEYAIPAVGLGGAATFGLAGQVKSLRQVAILRDSPSQIALMLLTSRVGDAANGTYDVLPGRARTIEGGPEWRMGAGILAAEVDSGAFLSVGKSTADWSYVVDSESTVGDFLFEFCLHTNSVAYVTRAGQLSVMTLAESSNASAMTIDSSLIVDEEPLQVEYDEDAISPHIALRCNYDPLTKQYVGEVTMHDTELSARYPNTDDALDLSSKSIVIAGRPIGTVRVHGGLQGIARPTVPQDAVAAKLRRIQVSEGRGRGYVSGRFHLPVMALGLGSVVELTATVPDLEGNTAVATKLARVIELGPRWDECEADMKLQLLDKLYVIAPGVRIASAAGAVLTLVSNGFEAQGSGGAYFADGMPVQVWDVSGATKVSRTVLSTTLTTVTLSSAPGFVVENDVDFIRPDNASLATTNEDLNGFDGFDFTYQIRNDENDPAVPFVSRWR